MDQIKVHFFGMMVLMILASCEVPNRTESYPVIILPENADTSSPIWKGIDLEPKPPVLPKSPSDQQATFELPPGYRMEPVLTEPQIEQPAAIAFDANGRMLVLELRTYMLTADGDGELEPTSVISRWEDRDNDGVYETGGTFVDSLIFPRFVLPWDINSVLTMESNQDNIYKHTDTDHDGRADTKEFFTGDFGRSGNVEHQQASLFYGMDNWMYSTVNAFRIRWTPTGVIRENTGFNRAQWGVTQDNYGKLWFQGGASGIPSYFQFPIYYGTFNVDDQLAEGFKVPWGAPMGLEDFQPGMRAVRRPDGSVKEVTGSAGNDVYRGHRLPAALVGQYFYGEPVARIVRQINPIVTEGITQLHNYYQNYKSEFLKSRDPLFRPVDMATAPDGTMYVVDMYHGIIQEGQWVQKGSYLRTKIEQYQLDKVVRLGRIWRITYDGIERDTTKPHMAEQSAEQLVKHLTHPNGWWRDMAQQELVRRRDTSVASILTEMARNSDNELARIHAIWTLEGLTALTTELVHDLFKDEHPNIRKVSMQASESLYKLGNKSLGNAYLNMMKDKDYNVVVQAMMTANILEVPGASQAIETAKKKYAERGVQVVADEILNPEARPGFFAPRTKYTDAEIAMIKKGAVIYQELCSTCHGAHGTGIPVGDGLMAPSLVNSPRLVDHPDYLLRVLLRGMIGPVDGETYSGGFMTPMAHETDEWVAAVASYIRTNLGNDAASISMEEVANARFETEGHKPYTYEQLMQQATRQLVPSQDWNVTASHVGLARIGGSGEAFGALTFEGWTTGVPQTENMWFQLEIPDPAQFTGIAFKSPPIRKGWGPEAPPPMPTYPRSYRIEISSNGSDWEDPVSQGDCDDHDNQIIFAPTEGRFLRVTQTAVPKEEAPWRMESLKVFAKGAAVM